MDDARALTREGVDDALADWPEAARHATRAVMTRYGLPHSVTFDQVLWIGNGEWKRTAVHRDEVPHRFPMPHSDVLEQWIDYRVPASKAADVAAFNGSIILHRTKGEVSVRCDREETNTLTLNLMHDVVTGRRTVEEARAYHAETTVAFLMHQPAPYATRLCFDITRGATADPDETLIAGPALEQALARLRSQFLG